MRKKILYISITILALVTIVIYVLDLSYLIRAVRVTYFTGHRTAFLEDYSYFDNQKIVAKNPKPWSISKNYNHVPITKRLQKTHDSLKTTSFLILKKDSIWHESYYDIGSVNSKTNSFSMAKSIVTSMLGKAIQLGMIENLDTKVTDYLPELEGAFAKDLTVGDLASMSSGLQWREDYYGPTSVTTQAYFKKDLRKLMLSLPIENKPGQKFIYQSGDTQLLAMVLEKAVKMPLNDFLSRYFWTPMGMENDALWQVDDAKNNMVKAYCCIASNARDFARFGKLYLQNGKWNDQQLLPADFVAKSTHPRFSDGKEYGYGWWLETINKKKVYYMRGHLGQFCIVIPEEDIIIVRLGHHKGTQTKENPHSNDLYLYVEEALKMLQQK